MFVCTGGENVHARWKCPCAVTLDVVYEPPSEILHSLIFVPSIIRVSMNKIIL